MHQQNSGFLGKHFYRLKKALLTIAFVTTLTFSASGQAINLISPATCSSGVTNLMSSMGLFAYEVADFLNSFCQAIPFFGSFCPDLDQIAGEFFSALLSNPDLTLEMMSCADTNPAMLTFMIHIMDENPELLDQMSGYLGQTGDGLSKGCQLGELLTAMGLRHSNLKNYLFAEMNSYLYANLAKNMQCETDTTVQLSELISQNPQELSPGTAFDRTMRKLGEVDSDKDGNEVSNERMFQAIFNDIDATNYFLDALDQLPGDEKTRVLDFVFLGKTIVTEVGCNPNFNSCGTSDVFHANQAYFNMYAMLDGFGSGVMSSYVFDPAYPPIPDSEIPANALFARMAPLLMTESLQLSDYGMSFFGSMLTGANVYQWQPGIDVLNDMVAIMDLGHLPFTLADLEPLLPILVNPNAPAPRNILDNSDCAEDVSACLIPIDCSMLGGYWYDNTCNALQQIQTAYFEGSLFYSQRKDIGPFTVDNDGNFSVTMSGTGDIDLYVRRNGRANEFQYDCKSDNPATSEESCMLYGSGDYWVSIWGDWEQETTYTLDIYNDPNIDGPPEDTGDAGTGCALDLPTCYTPNLCTAAGGYWYDSVCNIIPPVQIAEITEQINPGDSRNFGAYTVNNDGNFLVELMGDGDVDLYVRKADISNTAGLQATADNYDCKSDTLSSSDEMCELVGMGVYWVYIVNNGSDISNFTLNITNDPIYIELTEPLDLWDVRLSENGDGRYLVEMFGEGFTDSNIYISGAQTFSGSLNWYEYDYYGPFNADMGDFTASVTGTGNVDLYVNDDGQPSPGSYFNTCNSESNDSNELCEIAEPGSSWVMVDAVDDSTYTLNIDYPKLSGTVYIISDNRAILISDTKPTGDIRIEGNNGQSVNLVIPDLVEPLAFNDADDDGLHDTLEIWLGTDSSKIDTDGDGISDLDEVNVDGDRTTYTPGVDSDPLFNENDADGDGINNDQDPLPEIYNYNDGDLAPLDSPDGLINAADYLIANRIVLGQLIAGDNQLAHGDVYPPGAPDGMINLSDVLLIQKMVLGE